jgi:hypothetical protein
MISYFWLYYHGLMLGLVRSEKSFAHHCWRYEYHEMKIRAAYGLSE